MEIAVGYIRRSQEDKNNVELSIENQERFIEEYCDRYNYKLLKIYNDGYITGSDWNRIEFNKMLDLVSEKVFNVIIVNRLNRFSRDPALTRLKCKILKAYKVRLLDTNNYDWTADATITGFISEADAKVTEDGYKSQRRMMDDKKNTGGIFGRPPFGYRLELLYRNKDNRQKADKVWVVDTDKAKKVRDVFNLFIDKYDYEEIQALTEINLSVINYILRNKKYCGYFKFTKQDKIIDKDGKEKHIIIEQGEYKIKAIPSIISEEIFNKANQILKERGYK